MPSDVVLIAGSVALCALAAWTHVKTRRMLANSTVLRALEFKRGDVIVLQAMSQIDADTLNKLRESVKDWRERAGVTVLVVAASENDWKVVRFTGELQ